MPLMEVVTEQERRAYLFAVVDNLASIRDAWVNSNSTVVTSELETACDELIAVFSDGAIPGDCRTLASEVEKFAREWNRFRERAAISEDLQLMPGPTFWKVYENIVAARKSAIPRKTPRLETIKELTEQKVPDRQICLIYGWVDQYGEPEIWRLREERDEPGKHTGEGFVPPHDKERRAAEQRQREIQARMRAKLEAKLAAVGDVGPESWSELFEQELSAKQIGKIRHCTIDEVMAKAEELGYPPPLLDYADPRTQEGKHDRPNKAAQKHQEAYRQAGAESVSDLPAIAPKRRGRPPKAKPAPIVESDDQPAPAEGDLTLEQKIMVCHEEGMKPEAISAELSTEELAITPAKVKAIIARLGGEDE